ncbi:MAG: FAD-binding oxidoreductase [Candidatus Nanopelagicales bacterium]
MSSELTRHRSHWGWGFEDEQASFEEVQAATAMVGQHLGFAGLSAARPVPLRDVVLAPARIPVPPPLAAFCTSDLRARVSHTYGKAYRDLVRGFYGQFDNPPDVVAFPRSEREIEQVLSWCSDKCLAAVPYGGGTSVVGGVEARLPAGYGGAVSMDLSALNRVTEVDPVSRAALIQAGAAGPQIERQLGEHDLTLRFFPQSFEFSTMGGWVATRAAGHFATGPTHIDDLVESVRAITPTGSWESLRLPGSGAGVSPDRMLLGSEGSLGVITEAWVRVIPKPTYRAGKSVLFPDFLAGAQALRSITQAGLRPANCRFIDAAEARLNGAGDGRAALLVLGFESADAPVDGALARALEHCRLAGGRWDSDSAIDTASDAAGSWRESFIRAPHLRDTLVSVGVLAETFETAITWDRLADFHSRVMRAGQEAITRVCGPGGQITARITHAYPDGAGVYFTVVAPAQRGAEIEQWDQIKVAVSDELIAAGGTITHHHAVGRDHRPWYDQQRPDIFAAALSGAKAAVDPASVMNPGVLIDAPGRSTEEGRKVQA